MSLPGIGSMVVLALSSQLAPPAPADVDAGRAVFEGKGQCLSCHRVQETGSMAARDLSWIGLLRTPEKLRAAVADPARHPRAASLTATDVDRLVEYLRSRRTLWALSGDAAE